MKGICLAGGMGTRLYPLSKTTVKTLLPVFDKPVIYYSVSSLLFCGIREILIIGKADDVVQYEKLFGDGIQLGLNIDYKIQENPNGIAEAFIIGEEFIGEDDVCLILGDNLFWGADLQGYFQEGRNELRDPGVNAVIYGFKVADPSAFGVVKLSKHGRPLSIEEKPKKPKSNIAVPGIYMYDNSVINVAKSIKKSARGEYEITAVNDFYLQRRELSLIGLGRGISWLDVGNPTSLFESSMLVYNIQKNSGLQIANLEEICYNMGYINREQLVLLIEKMPNCDYKEYLEKVIEEEN